MWKMKRLAFVCSTHLRCYMLSFHAECSTLETSITEGLATVLQVIQGYGCLSNKVLDNFIQEVTKSDGSWIPHSANHSADLSLQNLCQCLTRSGSAVMECLFLPVGSLWRIKPGWKVMVGNWLINSRVQWLVVQVIGAEIWLEVNFEKRERNHLDCTLEWLFYVMIQISQVYVCQCFSGQRILKLEAFGWWHVGVLRDRLIARQVGQGNSSWF